MSDLRKEYSAYSLITREKISGPALKKIYLMACNAGKKFLHHYMLGKKFLALEVSGKNILTENQITHPTSPKVK